MRKEVQHFIQSRPELTRFVREQPIWYRILSRNPEKITGIEKAAKVFYGQTFPQRVDRLGQQIQMVQMLISMMYGMKG